MKLKKETDKKIKKPKIGWVLYWSPRILSILFLLFLAIFSLDIFESCNSFLECLIGLFMHNIPVLILAILLWISWKRELIGTITFTLGGLAYITMIMINSINNGFEWYYLVWSLQIACPSFIIAFLWYLNYKKKR
ncbi:hypothetical protein J4429_01315 [Candidatus Pacearchaeota archaeon]|nr:hypothetical protein [Candidatus Pacearchaeota archaeon]